MLFVKGQSGNTAGRPRGRRNKADRSSEVALTALSQNAIQNVAQLAARRGGEPSPLRARGAGPAIDQINAEFFSSAPRPPKATTGIQIISRIHTLRPMPAAAAGAGADPRSMRDQYGINAGSVRDQCRAMKARHAIDTSRRRSARSARGCTAGRGARACKYQGKYRRRERCTSAEPNPDCPRRSVPTYWP